MMNDQAQRRQALNPAESFIVQAPAGSGKTELLIQRYLSLLATVHFPEEIWSITFTKKAANEMRERLIAALDKAKKTEKPESEHAQTTHQLAQAVLARDREKEWQLLQNPNRLKIQTIDALSYRLNNQLPILSGLGFAPTISNNPKPLYQQAVHTLLKGLEKNAPWSKPLSNLLLHLDNQYALVEALLIRLLEKRDQWLPHLFNEEKSQRQHLEQALVNINQETLSELDRAFTAPEKTSLLNLLSFANKYLEIDDSPDHFKLDAAIEHKSSWLALADLLLTKEDTWRKQLTKNNGFPSKLDDKPQERKSKALKEECLSLIEHFTQRKQLKFLLTQLRLLPPCSYSEKQWTFIEDLMELLPIACAQLRLGFAERQEIDYIENAQAALQALGDDEQVTDLALSLDYQLKHLLIDEFQDTSISQLRLIEKLTLNWQANDSRSLFIVGDPMQSIYRFREADVGLFLHVKEHGLQALRLTPLTLTTNFRSNQTLIDWINQTFASAFPAYHDINTGAVSFTPAQAIKQDPGSISFYNTQDTGKTIVEIIQKTLAHNPAQSIAILVRAKTHLTPIIAELKQAKISYQAVEIEQLKSSSLLYDALALTKALCQLADTTAWLSLLKTPFCGLSLMDLTQLSDQTDNTKTLWDTLQTAQLSSDGKQRLQHILPILKRQLANRRRKNLSEWILETWQGLQADRYYTQSHHQIDLETFLTLLDTQTQGGDIYHWKALEEAIEQLTAASENNDSPIHIMTLHKAKGLEFDTVILPELQRRPRQNSAELLLWQERILASNQSDLLLAPIKAKDEQSSGLYRFLQHAEDLKLQHEVTRLFYVACTRAKSHLHLLATLDTDKSKELRAPDSRSLLATIWESCQPHFKIIETVPQHDKQLMVKSKRFTVDAFSSRNARFIDPLPPAGVGSSWQDPTPKIIGITVHRIMQNLGEQGFTWWENLDKVQYITRQLRLNGLAGTQQDEAITRLLSLVDNMLTDEKARWILQPRPGSVYEYPISGLIQGKLCHFIVDRFFIDTNDQAWLIDYKIILSDHLDTETEAKHYAEQLKQYQILLSGLYHTEINAALYFPVQKVLLKM